MFADFTKAPIPIAGGMSRSGFYAPGSCRRRVFALFSVAAAFDPAVLEKAVVNVATRLAEDYPDIGMIVLECTDMPPYAEAVRQKLGSPVFDAVDMVKRVNAMVASPSK